MVGISAVRVFFKTMGEITASLCIDCNAPTEREQLMEKDRKITEAMTVNRKNNIFFYK